MKLPTMTGVLVFLALGPIVPGAIGGSVAEIKARGRLIMLCVPHQESHFVRTRLDAGPMRREGTVEHFEGVDVDIMAAFADYLGVTLEIWPAVGADGFPSYRALIRNLAQAKGDIAASSLSITEEREKVVDFSESYYVTRPVIVVTRDSDVESVEDLAGKVASTIPGSSQEEHLERLGFSGDAVRGVDFMLENYNLVDEGAVDFTLVDSGSADRVLPGFPNLRVAFQLSVEDPYGIAVPPGSDLLEPLNRFLNELRSSGDLDRIFADH